MENNIYIIGAGAVGKALAVFLKLEGKNVYIIRGSVDNIPTQYETISVQIDTQTILKADIEVTSLSSHSAFDGILVVTNKSFGNEKLAETLKLSAKYSPIVLLQNGLGVESPFLEKGFTDIHRCVLFTTCQVVAENLVRFKPVAVSQIGIINGKEDTLQHIVNHLNNPIFQFRSEENIQYTIWKKAIANCVFNSICPLLDTDNGVFLRDKGVMDLAQNVISECVAIANLSGIEITEQEVIESVLMISKMSDGQLISTLQDINNKRKTEIETLNFAVVAIAQKLGKKNQVVQTKLLGELTKIKADLKFCQ
ncbi:2-dehydropantoate 2-reductase [Arcicella rosea]|uniref:ketopantoate reductase family protein n=1 Tax=Arcicella rosea TaxID=502909 RepID=UPI00345D6E8E